VPTGEADEAMKMQGVAVTFDKNLNLRGVYLWNILVIVATSTK
jgi:hypothetical protein